VQSKQQIALHEKILNHSNPLSAVPFGSIIIINLYVSFYNHQLQSESGLSPDHLRTRWNCLLKLHRNEQFLK